mgnify:CR=1 FL=1
MVSNIFESFFLERFDEYFESSSLFDEDKVLLRERLFFKVELLVEFERTDIGVVLVEVFVVFDDDVDDDDVKEGDDDDDKDVVE